MCACSQTTLLQSLVVDVLLKFFCIFIFYLPTHWSDILLCISLSLCLTTTSVSLLCHAVVLITSTFIPLAEMIAEENHEYKGCWEMQSARCLGREGSWFWWGANMRKRHRLFRLLTVLSLSSTCWERLFLIKFILVRTDI